MTTPRDAGIPEMIAARAAEAPEACAISAPGRSPLSYRVLERQVAESRRALAGMGLGRLDRVALVLPPGPEMAVAALSVAAGGICAPLNPAYRGDEYGRHLARLRPAALVVQGDLDSPARPVARQLGIPVVDLVSSAGAPAGCFELASSRGRAPRLEPARLDDVALILPTSGTTAHPKLVPLTHASLCASAHATAASLALGPGDRCLNVMPLFHIHGLVGALLASLASGGSVVCTPGLHAPTFLALLAAERATWYTAVPTMHQAILAHAPRHAEEAAGHALRFIRSCSAPLPPAVLAELEAVFGVPVIEAYGMTEAAHQVTSNPLPPRARKPGGVGLATGPDVALLDAAGTPLAPGQTGEVAIRGITVTRGYLDDPEANAHAFTGGWFRTGDQGRIDADGHLVLTGRLKELINRAGEKIAPREVEEALLAHPAVAGAVAFAAPHAQLGEEVAAAVALRDGAAATARDLRAFVAARLADFKVPRRVLFVPELPQGPTGKLQRHALAGALGLSAGDAVSRSPAASVGPRNPLEAEVAAIWREVLTVDTAGIHDDFFDAGGDSLLATQLLARTRRALAAEVPLHVFFEAPTIAALAQQVASSRDGAATVPGPRPGALAPAADAPLSFAQERAWFFDQFAPQNPAYNRPLALRLRGPLDAPALGRSLDEIVRRHAVLHATFPSVADEPVQRPGPIRALAMPLVDLSGMPPSEREAAARREAAATTRLPFDLAHAPPLRAALYRLAEGDHVLLVVLHHILVDGWSASVLAREIAALYDAFAVGRESPLPELPLQYADVTVWQREWMQGEVLESRLAYWKARLAGAPPTLTLPSDRPRPAHPTFDGGRETIEVPEPLGRALRALSREEGATLFMALLAAFAALLHRYTGRDDLVVGVPVAARTHVETEGLIGCFINTVAIRTDCAGAPSFRALLGRVREVAREAYANGDVPFGKVVEALRPGRDPSYAPLVQVVFNLEHFPEAPARAAEVAMEEFSFDPRTAPMELLVEVIERGPRLSCVATYHADLFEPDTIRRFLGHYVTLLESVAADPEQPIARAPLLSAAERGVLLGAWSGRAAPYPDCCLHELFEAQVERTPDAPAVLHGGGAPITYRELNRRANRLAHHLRDRGVGPESRVAICLDRTPAMVEAALAVFKAGGAYLSLDPMLPPDRMALMIEETRSALVLTSESLADRLPESGAAVIRVDALRGALEGARDDNPRSGVTPDGLAYIVYTSGSTGRPKGTLGIHRGMVSMLACWWRTYPFAPGDVWAQRSSLLIADFLQELLVALPQGVPVALMGEDEVREPVRLLGAAVARGVTRMMIVPAIARAWLDTVPDLGRRLAGLRLLSVGGEAFPRDLYRKLHAVLPGCRLLEGYGMNEASTKSLWCDTSRVDVGRPTIPMGWPIDNVEIYVLDRSLEPVPVGVSGELYVGGVGLARGYVDRPDLTAERFVPHPFARTPGARLYRSGDLARFLPDGSIEGLGRIDHQVKVRGMRVEPAEVQAALERHPAVRQAVVLVRTDGPREPGLVAYVAADRDPAPAPRELRQFAKRLLPDYMVPSTFVVLEALPLLPGGKVDRAALPAPDFGRRNLERAYVAPRGPAEQELAAIWADALGLDRVGVTDDFFELGGHSLLAAQIISRVVGRFGVDVTVRMLLEAPTVAELAMALALAVAEQRAG